MPTIKRSRKGGGKSKGAVLDPDLAAATKARKTLMVLTEKHERAKKLHERRPTPKSEKELAKGAAKIAKLRYKISVLESGATRLVDEILVNSLELRLLAPEFRELWFDWRQQERELATTKIDLEAEIWRYPRDCWASDAEIWDTLPPCLTPLRAAAATADAPGLQRLLTKHGARVNSSDSRHFDNALHVLTACCAWDAERRIGLDEQQKRSVLSDESIRKEAVSEESQTQASELGTSAQAAMKAEELEWGKRWVASCRHLLTAKVDIDTKNRAGETALIIAAESGFVPLIKVLLEAGADFNARDKVGRSPLHAAAAQGRPAACTTLLAAGAELAQLTGPERQTAEVRENCVESGELVVPQSSDEASELSAVCSRSTPLHLAVTAACNGLISLERSSHTLEALLSHSSAMPRDADLEDGDGITALELAASEQCVMPLCVTLFRHGADPKQVDKVGRPVRDRINARLDKGALLSLWDFYATFPYNE